MKKIGEVVKVTSVVCTLLFAFGASGANRTWSGDAGDGKWETAGNWVENAVPVAGDIAFFSSNGAAITVDITDNRTVQQLRVNGTADVVLNIAGGARLSVANGGADGIQVLTANLTVIGDGELGLSTIANPPVGNLNHLDNGVAPGFALTINVKITAPNGSTLTGIEMYRASSAKGGTVVLGYPGNDFEQNIAASSGHTIVADTLTNIGLPSSIGAGDAFVPNRGGVLRYTGPAVSTDRIFLLNGGDTTLGYGGGIEQEGTGILTWAGPIYNNSNFAQTFALFGDSAFEGCITGSIYNNQGTLAINKSGNGTWVLSGDNTFSGGIMVSGGTLGLDSPTAAGASAAISLMLGVNLSVNPSATDNFTATFPAVSAAGPATLTIAEAATASAVTFGGLHGNIAVVAPNAGDPANRIFVSGLAAGPVAGITVNGVPAEYDLTDGLIPSRTPPAVQGGIAVKGGILPNDANAIAEIDTAVVNGDPIALTANPNALFDLTMKFTGDDATVDTANKTLLANAVAVAPGAGALTIGVDPQDGTLLPPLAAAPDASTIAALKPLIWYDPSDTATVLLDAANLVTNLANKGTGGPAFDAVKHSSLTAPLYVTGPDSDHAMLPTMRFTGAQGL